MEKIRITSENISENPINSTVLPTHRQVYAVWQELKEPELVCRYEERDGSSGWVNVNAFSVLEAVKRCLL